VSVQVAGARRWARWADSLLLLSLAATVVWPPASRAENGAPASPAALEIGKNIYRHGLLPSGQSVKARTEGDAPFSGAQLTCVNCHRRSGLGSSEGKVGIPPITGNYLFQPGTTSREGIFQTQSIGPGTRPAYTPETLRRAIRDGVDPLGRELGPAMPRYALGDGEIDALTAYLRTLSAEPSPGVTDTDIHFATIITDGVDLEKSQALREVMEAYFEDRNAEIRNETLRGQQTPVMGMTRMYKAYRKWKLHTWTLSGAPETWTAQLESYYRAQPVFAVLSGIAAGDWQPVHRFCEGHELPCLLPITDLPEIPDTGDFYTVYYSRGLTLEAHALATHLSQTLDRKPLTRVVQVFRSGDSAGKTASASLRDSLKSREQVRLLDWDADTRGAIDWQKLVRETQAEVLVLWLRDRDLTGLTALAGDKAPALKLFLSSSLIDDRARTLPVSLYDRVLLVHPFDLPAASERKFIRTRNWLRLRDIPVKDMRVQASAYLALTMANRAVRHLRNNYSRDFFIERIEHMMDNIVSTFIYPRLSLGPGQRFASKGAYIVKPVAGKEELSAVSEWIVP
jgi:mono/diheme cytochrome c family protein